MQPTESFTFTLAPYGNLLEYRPNPQGDEVERQAKKWAREFLLPLCPSEKALEILLDGRPSAFITMCYPSMSPERMLTWYKLSFIAFVLDDLYCPDGGDIYEPGASKSLLKGIMAIVNGSMKESDNICLQLFIEAWNQTCELSGPGTQKRITTAWTEMMAAFVKEVDLPNIDYSFEELYQNRSRTAMYLPMAYVEYGLGEDLDERVVENADICKLYVLARDHALLTHEIWSYRKEYYSGGALSLVEFWARPGGSKIQEAMDKAWSRVASIEEEFIAIRDQLFVEMADIPLARKYISELEALAAGALRFSCICPRYNGVDHSWNGALSGKFILTPEKTIYPPREQPI
ncbi:hypothetical protein TWF694_010208 [Orbilia ellipsospora]|uniref:Terpene synthase n=1 Tax=Orbilia ellipsospora TaxID=2528407 RepID=A0AAV9X964_9PEZI